MHSTKLLLILVFLSGISGLFPAISQASVLASGDITALPIDVAGIVFVLIISLIFLIPFALFVRGIIKSEKNPSSV